MKLMDIKLILLLKDAGQVRFSIHHQTSSYKGISLIRMFRVCINSSPVAHRPLEIATGYLNFHLVAQIGYWK